MEGGTWLGSLATSPFISGQEVINPQHIKSVLGQGYTFQSWVGGAGSVLTATLPPHSPRPSLPLRDKDLNLTSLLVGSGGGPRALSLGQVH